jgi:HSP20 family protein
MTTVVRWNPIREMAAMQSAMDRLFENTWRDVRPEGDSLPLDVHETNETYTVIASLPGVNVDDIEVSLHDGILYIKAEIAQPEIDENTRILAQERSFGKFSRSIRMPEKVDADNVEADYSNGVLTLTLHKAPEAKPRQINIRSN